MEALTSVFQCLMEIVMPVPFQLCLRHATLVGQHVHELGHAARQRRTRIGHGPPHGVAQPDLDGDAAVLLDGHQVLDEGHDEAVDVGPRQVLQVTSGPDARLDGRPDDAEVQVCGLASIQPELLEDVIVRGRGEDSGFAQAQVCDQLEVVRIGPDPTGHLRIAPAQR